MKANLPLGQRLFETMPGLLLTGLVAWLGIRSSDWIGRNLLGFEKSPVSGIMMAIIIGLVFANLFRLPVTFKAGIRFSLKRLLKLGIILLGIRLSLGSVVQVGLIGLPVIVACVAGGFVIARYLGRRLDLSARLAVLIAVGTSICGATAIVATAPIIDAKEEEMAYAVANITLFGIVAMFLYPFIAHALFAQHPLQAGLFLGTAIHETAQVAGSGLIYSQMYGIEQVLNTATITKLVRNLFMLVVIPGIVFVRQRTTHDAQEDRRFNLGALFPKFILGFLLVALLRTIGDATVTESGSALGLFAASDWRTATDTVNSLAEILLAVAMAGVGLGTRLRELLGLGIKPFYVGFGAAVSVAGISLLAMLALQFLGINT